MDRINRCDYAILVEDDEASPRARAGDYVMVSKDEPLVPDALVVIRLRDGAIIIRRFVRYDKGEAHDEIVIERLNPAQACAVYRRIVESVHRIVAVYRPEPAAARGVS